MKKTESEVREEFIEYAKTIARYWSTMENKTDVEKCEGVVFSILNIFDGSTMSLPAMDIVLRPHEEDKQYCIENGEDWYEDGMVINDCMLHEMFVRK